MLCGIPPILSPELLKVLCEMGHGDEIVIADGNFPGASCAKNSILLRADGHGVPELLDAILTLFSCSTSMRAGRAYGKSATGRSTRDTYLERVSRHRRQVHNRPFEFMSTAFTSVPKSVCNTHDRRARNLCQHIIKKGVVKFKHSRKGGFLSGIFHFTAA